MPQSLKRVVDILSYLLHSGSWVCLAFLAKDAAKWTSPGETVAFPLTFSSLVAPSSQIWADASKPPLRAASCAEVSREVYRRNGHVMSRTPLPLKSKSLSLQSVLLRGHTAPYLRIMFLARRLCFNKSCFLIV